METAPDRYLREHSSPQSEALEWIEKQTHLRTNYPRMLSGSVQGKFLTLLVKMTGARNVLEIGSFTGYSATCLAYGFPQKEDGSREGHIDALELNDELQALMTEGWKRAGVLDCISLHIGDARESLKSLRDRRYDLVFIDADKREYCEYYDAVIGMVDSGGVIVADDVLWDGKVYQEPMPHDRQTRGIASFNDMVASDPRVENVILPLRDGLNIIRKL